MKGLRQRGFSLVELLVVVAIVGLISAICIPYLKKAKYAAENSAIYATTKVMSKEQLNFYAQKSRYARLDELNTLQNNGFGTYTSNSLKRGNFTYVMQPVTPTDAELRVDYTIVATKTIDSSDVPYVVSLNSTGEITQITP